MIKWAKEQFGRYIAAEPTTRRRDPGTDIKSSDVLLDDTKRRRVIEGARELNRNYSVAAWAIRKHLDYVASFQFQAKTDNPELNDRLEDLVEWYSRPLNCDASARHSLSRIVRLAEMRAVVDGDIFLLKIRDGRMQAIEGDRVRNPDLRPEDVTNWTHGIETGKAGRARRVSVHRRGKWGRYEHEKNVPISNIYQHGYFDSFDQVRGVSPLASAIAEFQDVHEVKDYARAKAKVTQLFALAVTRELSDFDDDEESGGEYQVDFGKGPIKLELDPGDKAEFLESKHPSTEFQAFLTMTLQAALKALDIPWSFFDEAYTNFFGSRAALMQYLQSCKHKRDNLKELLDRITAWRFSMFIANGTLVLPPGVELRDLKWDWIPAGVPWWDPSKEVQGDIMAVNAGFRTRSEIRRERYGDNWKDVIDKLAEEEAYMREKQVDPIAALPAQWPQPTEAEDEKKEEENEDSDSDE